jgi:transcriptional regulator with PAS, ATPase and Fis domain
MNSYDSDLYDLLSLVFEEFAGALIVDKDTRIVLITPRYCEILGIEPNQALGKPVRDVIPNTRMPYVLETGQPEIGHIWEIKGDTAIINRIPIRKDNQVIGAVAFSVFRTMDEIKDFMKRLNKLDAELKYYRNEVEKLRGARYSLENIVGSSQAISEARDQLSFIAKNDSTVLITGETGTGKEIFAHALHLSSKRRFGHFIKINCAAIPDELMESELFGYEAGAFTGARQGGKPGKFELAHRGTLFLDEIGDLSVRLQAKLLRALQDGEIEKVGGVEPVKVDVRILAATNANLEEQVRLKQFREDLYYRLNVVALQIPPLRDRKEDIAPLAECFIRQLNERLGIRIECAKPEVLQFFRRYDWPGNVRELYNTLERTMNSMRSGKIGMEEIQWFVPKVITSLQKPAGKTGLPLREMELDFIFQTIEVCGGNISRAAEMLGVHRSTIYNRMKKNR